MAEVNTGLFNICQINKGSLFGKKQLMLKGPLSLTCITETWYNQCYSNALFCLEGYTIIRHDRNLLLNPTGKKSGRGEAIYIRENLSFKIISKSKNDSSLKYLSGEI